MFVDANVLFSALYLPPSVPSRVLNESQKGAFRLVLSNRVIEEVTRNIHRKLPQALALLVELLVRGEYELIEDGTPQDTGRWVDLGLTTDASIAASAIEVGVDFVCTGDRRLREVLAEHGGSVQPLSPRELLTLLGLP